MINVPDSVQFCVQCGSRLTMEEKFGRNRPVCPACGWIYFSDPKVAVAVVILEDNRVLLVQRVNPPFQGYWSLPAGFMDGDEEPGEAASRECLEETGLVVKTCELMDVISGREHPQGADLVLIYRAESTGGFLQAGDDAEQAKFFALERLPPLAFTATNKTLAKLKVLMKTSKE
jgi:8-oxo-dGTP diphosphatase